MRSPHPAGATSAAPTKVSETATVSTAAIVISRLRHRFDAVSRATYSTETGISIRCPKRSQGTNSNRIRLQPHLSERFPIQPKVPRYAIESMGIRGTMGS